jgi:hypothetical protein
MATIDISAEEPQQQGTGKVWDRAATTSRALKILIVIAAAIVFANVVVGNPVVLFANATASLVGPWAPQSLTGDEIALFRKATYQAETVPSGPDIEALAKQFQAWAAEVDARAQVKLPGQPAKDLRASVVQKTKSVQVQRHNRPEHKARPAVRRTKHARRQMRREQYALVHDWFAPARWRDRHFGWLY